MRAYGRSSKFKEAVGDQYYALNDIESWEAREEPYPIGRLEITWEQKDGYNVGIGFQEAFDYTQVDF